MIVFKNIKFPRGNYRTDSFRGINTLLSLLFTTKFSSTRQLKSSQNPLNADQSNIYPYAQSEISIIRNVNCLKNTV